MEFSNETISLYEKLNKAQQNSVGKAIEIFLDNGKDSVEDLFIMLKASILLSQLKKQEKDFFINIFGKGANQISKNKDKIADLLYAIERDLYVKNNNNIFNTNFFTGRNPTDIVVDILQENEVTTKKRWSENDGGSMDLHGIDDNSSEAIDYWKSFATLFLEEMNKDTEIMSKMVFVKYKQLLRVGLDNDFHKFFVKLFGIIKKILSYSPTGRYIELRNKMLDIINIFLISHPKSYLKRNLPVSELALEEEFVKVKEQDRILDVEKGTPLIPPPAPVLGKGERPKFAFLTDITKGVELKKAKPGEPRETGVSDALMSALRKGVTLKKTAGPIKMEKEKTELELLMEKRRKAMHPDEESTDDEEWALDD